MQKIKRIITNGVEFIRKHGLRAACRAAARRVRRPGGTRGDSVLPHRFAYEAVSYRHRERPRASSPLKTINWVIPNFYGASGGHTTIFRLTRGLEAAGYEVHFYIFGDTHYVSDSEATAAMRSGYFPLRASVHTGVAQMRPAEVCIASSWETAYAVRDFDACRRKLYFVQDYEPSFFPAGTEMVLAENTYRFGFECICAGPWLAQRMREYGNRAEHFDLAYDPEVYSPGRGGYRRNRVLFYARPQTPRRGTGLGLAALALLKRRRPEVEVILYGSDDVSYEVPFEFTPGGILRERELAELYRGATVGLSVSLTNYSLVPQEMLACGLPVVEMDLPSLRAAYPSESAGLRLAPPDPERIADALDSLLSLSDVEVRRARNAAADLVGRLSWARAEERLLDFVKAEGTERGAAPLKRA